MQKLLIDTSDKYLCVGIAKDDKLEYSNCFEAWQRQSEYLVPEIVKALESLNLKMKDIDEIVVSKGPGSYTGVRIALTFAKTLGVVAHIKVKAISSLKVFGLYDENYISVINARSKRSYIGVYQHGKSIVEDTIMNNDDAITLIDKYQKEGFKLYGDASYLDMKSEPAKIIDGLLSYSKYIEEDNNVLNLKPVYLKDNYDY